ncbi:MAG TPA: cell division topological specificity factor MinE [Herpetosiphonaceae bacterium]
MGLFDSLFGRKPESSSAVAKERLLTVLVHDRVHLTPADMDEMKREIIAVIGRYVEITNPDAIEVTLTRGEASDHLKADIPLGRTRHP